MSRPHPSPFPSNGPNIRLGTRYLSIAAVNSPNTRSPSDFTAVACGSFAATIAGVLILIRTGILIHRLVWGGSTNTPAANSGSGRSVGTSAEHKKEIDGLRLAAIRRHLKNFTVTVNEDGIAEHSSELTQPTLPTSNDKLALYQSLSENDSIPAPSPTNVDLSQSISNQNSSADEEKKLLVANINEEGTSTNIDEAKAAHMSYAPKSAAAQLSIPSNCCDISIHTQCHNTMCGSNESTRNILAECTICQEAYKPSDKICYSSNPKCKHVFHEQCILRWLVSLGWMKVKEHTKVLDMEHLLRYELECPVCRQVFVDKAILLGTSGNALDLVGKGGDINV